MSRDNSTLPQEMSQTRLCCGPVNNSQKCPNVNRMLSNIDPSLNALKEVKTADWLITVQLEEVRDRPAVNPKTIPAGRNAKDIPPRRTPGDKMGKVNIWVKRSFIVVASLMAVIGALMLAGTLFMHGHYHRDEEMEDMIVGIRATYTLAVTMLFLPVVGLYGVCKEKKWMIIVFTVGVILCSLFAFYIGIGLLFLRPTMKKTMTAYYTDMQPFSNATQADVKILHETQRELECCGVEQGYQDWGYHIPESCLCTDNSTSACVAAPQNSSLFRVTDDPVMIYGEPCLPTILQNVDLAVDITTSTAMGLTLLWTLACVLSIIILCQLKPKKDTHAVAYSREAKTGNYAVLTEPAELT